MYVFICEYITYIYDSQNNTYTYVYIYIDAYTYMCTYLKHQDIYIYICIYI